MNELKNNSVRYHSILLKFGWYFGWKIAFNSFWIDERIPVRSYTNANQQFDINLFFCSTFQLLEWTLWRSIVLWVNNNIFDVKTCRSRKIVASCIKWNKFSDCQHKIRFFSFFILSYVYFDSNLRAFQTAT